MLLKLLMRFLYLSKLAGCQNKKLVQYCEFTSQSLEAPASSLLLQVRVLLKLVSSMVVELGCSIAVGLLVLQLLLHRK